METNEITNDRKLTEQTPTAPVARPSEPKEYEKAAMQALRTRRIKTPRVKSVETKAGLVLSLDHPDPAHGQALLMRALATGDVDFFGELLVQLGKASVHDQKVNERELNFLVAIIKGIEPRDQLETMLAAQMAAVHTLTMNFACRLANADNPLQQDSAERTLNKLARTFAAQVEALKRYRTGGEQKVTVHHVSVSDGGQAIVGNVSHGGPGAPEKPESTS